MKKKVLFVNYYYRFGGVSSSLNNLLTNMSEIDYDLYEVDLFLLNPLIDSKYTIPNEVRLIAPRKLTALYFSSFQKTINEGSFIDKCIIIFLILLSKVFGYKNITKLVIMLEKNLSGYDISISYTNDIYKKNSSFFKRNYSGGCNFFVKKKVTSGKKVAWIHNDASKLNFNYKICKQSYESFDLIINVSKECKRIFDDMIPEYMNKSFVIGNTLDINDITINMNLPSPYLNKRDNIIEIVSVSRIDNQQKRIDRIIFVAEELRKLNYQFHWTIVGDGIELADFINQVVKKDLTEFVKFVGKKNNPYIYMKNADLFVLCSAYEAQGMVISESLITETPVLTTDFSAAHEFIKNDFNGKIVDNNKQALLVGVKEILENPTLINTYKENISRETKSNNYNQFQKVLGLL